MGDTDKRVVKTKKSIKEAFIKLLERKKYDDITITDICNLAQINRKTFYSHYLGVYSVLEEVEDTLIETVVDTIRQIDMYDFVSNPKPTVNLITDALESHMKYLFKLADMASLKDLQPIVMRKIVNTLIENFKGLVKDEDELRITVEFIASGLSYIFSSWMSGNYKMSLDELNERISSLIINGLGNSLNIINK